MSERLRWEDLPGETTLDGRFGLRTVKDMHARARAIVEARLHPHRETWADIGSRFDIHPCHAINIAVQYLVWQKRCPCIVRERVSFHSFGCDEGLIRVKQGPRSGINALAGRWKSGLTGEELYRRTKDLP